MFTIKRFAESQSDVKKSVEKKVQVINNQYTEIYKKVLTS